MANVYAPLPMPHDMPGEWPANPTIKEMSVPSEFEALLLSRRDRARLLVLPRAGPMMPRREDTAGSKPAYNDLDILTVRVLRRSGIDIDVLHDEDERRTSAQFGADLVIALGLFITQAIAEEEIQNLYQYIKSRIADTRAHLTKLGRDDAGVVLAVDLLRVKSPDGTAVEMRGVRGPAEETAELLREALRGSNRPASGA